MPLPVEGAGVGSAETDDGIAVLIIAHHRDVPAEVDVGSHLGIEISLSVLHEFAELFPFFLRTYHVTVIYEYGYNHGAVGCDGGGSREFA